MDIVKTVKDKLEKKLKELEDLKRRRPIKCGEVGFNLSLDLAIKIEELEGEIEELKGVLEKMKCKVCGTKENLIKVKDEEGNLVYVCENCYESVCEGFERIDAENDFYGKCC